MAWLSSSGVNVGVEVGVGAAVASLIGDVAGTVDATAVGETVGISVGSEDEQAANVNSNAAIPTNQNDFLLWRKAFK